MPTAITGGSRQTTPTADIAETSTSPSSFTVLSRITGEGT